MKNSPRTNAIRDAKRFQAECFPVNGKLPLDDWKNNLLNAPGIHTQCNWNIATGHAITPVAGSLLSFLDVDAFPVEQLYALVPKLAQTYTVIRGEHRHLYVTRAYPLSSAYTILPKINKVDQLSWRGVGAYVVGAGSLHYEKYTDETGKEAQRPTGQTYQIFIDEPVLVLTEAETRALDTLFTPTQKTKTTISTKNLPTIKAALKVISPDVQRETWVKVGQAIQSELGEDGFTLFDKWSSGSSEGKYNAKSTGEVYRSFHKNGIGLGTLCMIADEFSTDWRPKEKKAKKPTHSQIADQLAGLVANQYGFDNTIDKWRFYNGQYWEQVQGHPLKLERLTETLIPNATHHAVVDTLKLSRSRLERPFTSRLPNSIAFANGIFNWPANTLLDNTPDNHLTHGLPYTLEPNRPYPVIQKFLSTLIPDPVGIQALMAHGGLSLMGDTKNHIALLLQGATRIGKTEALNLMNALCGLSRGSFADKLLFSSDLEGSRHRGSYKDRPLVCVDELPANYISGDIEDVVKNMIGHGGVSMRLMRENVNLTNMWSSKLLMSSNNPPRFSDSSGALAKRLIIIPLTDQTIEDKDQDKYLYEKMLEELPGFAWACLEAARGVLSTGEYPRSERMITLNKELIMEGNPIIEWFTDEYEFDLTGFVVSDDYYASYENWAKDSGHKNIKTKQEVTKTLTLRYPRTLQSIQQRIKYGDFTKIKRGLSGMRKKLT